MLFLGRQVAEQNDNVNTALPINRFFDKLATSRDIQSQTTTSITTQITSGPNTKSGTYDKETSHTHAHTICVQFTRSLLLLAEHNVEHVAKGNVTFSKYNLDRCNEFTTYGYRTLRRTHK